MQFQSWLFVSLNVFFNYAIASPIFSNVTMMIQDRATPTTAVTAAQLSLMQLYAQYAAAAYCNSASSKVGSRITCSGGACPLVASATVVNFAYLGFSQSQAQGFIGIDSTNKQIVISFMGTNNLDNLIADLLVPFNPCDVNLASGCKLHTGFQYAWGDVSSATKTALAKAVKAYPTYKIIITGHSLGGAVATIGGAFLRAAGYNIDIYSYGSPRVGNTAFVNAVNAQAGSNYRVTHYNDPIARYPAKLFGYRHTSPEFWLYTGSATTTSYTAANVKVCTGIANTDCNDSTSSWSLTAHSYYFQAAQGALEGAVFGKGGQTQKEI